ncbi:MAG: Ig-like domain-containing protein [Lachnospiraceae bacterium]|nr:Ig-like domain-containing protein [Candidatus Colinaster scatohippi]
MKFTNRLLAAVLAATMLISSVPLGTFAEEIGQVEEVNTEFADETESMGESDSEASTDSVDGSLEGTEEAACEAETDDKEADSLTDNQAVSDDNNSNIETIYYIDDDYASDYSIDDLKPFDDGLFYGKGTYSDDELMLESTQIYTDEKSAALYIKGCLRDRQTVFTFSTTQKYDLKELIELACSDDIAVGTKEGGYLRANYIGMSAGIGGSEGHFTYTVSPRYTSSAAQEKEVDIKVQAIVSSLGLRNAGKSELEKVTAINDYLVNNIVYGSDGTDVSHGSYAALVKGKCVCQGYSAAFYRLCKEAGIDCRYIIGSRIGHAWNIVCLSELENAPVWYNMDVTWNDSDSTGSDRFRFDFFLKNDIDFIGHPRNDTYLTDAFMNRHPMAQKSYNSPQRLLDVVNPEFIFKDINNNSIKYTSLVNETEKRPKLLVFYGTKDQRSKESIELISRSKAATASCADIYAIEIRGASVAEIKLFEKENAKNGTIHFITSESGNNFGIANQYLKYIERRNVVSSTPVVVMIDGDNIIRIVSEGYITNYDIDRLCMPELRSEWDIDAPVLENITLNRTELRLGKSSTITGVAQLTVQYNPANCIDPKYTTFVSSDENVATVDENGYVKAVGKGEAVIIARCSRHTAEVKVTVFEYAEAISIMDASGAVLDDGTLNIFSGDENVIKLATSPVDSVIRGSIQWKVSNPEIVDIAVSEDKYSAVVTASSELTKQERVTIHAEADGYNAKCDLLIEPSMLKLNANGGTIDGKAYSYYRVKQGEAVGNLPIPDARKGYYFVGWSTLVGIRGDEYVSANTIFNNQWELLAVWRPAEPGKMWVKDLGCYDYTGKVIKPVVRVYDGDILLKEGVDYSLIYKNNLKAYTYMRGDAEFDETKAPCVIIVGKNNYENQMPVYFTITKKEITDWDIITNIDSVNKTENGRQILPIPDIKWEKIQLKNNTDFILEYPDKDKEGAYTKPGTYPIVIVGKGNYSGTRTIEMQIYSKNLININKATVRNLKNYEYNGDFIRQGKDFALVYGGQTLKEGYDYTITYSDNKYIGTARMCITGIGSYTGIKRLAFRITGYDIAKAKAVVGENGVSSVVYTGQAVEPSVNITYKVNPDNVYTLKKSTDGGLTGDYTVSYSNNINAGTGKITINGINGYSGTLVKTFRIIPYNVANLGETRFNIVYQAETEYCKSGAKPAVIVDFESRKSSGTKEPIRLTEGKDFTLKYVNNTKIYSLGEGDAGFRNSRGITSAPTIQIVLKGNYTGKIVRYYKIIPGLLREQAYITAPDVIYSPKVGKCFSKITVSDVMGRRLVAGTDYNSNVEYRYATIAVMTDGSTRTKDSIVGKSDSPVSGTKINVIVTGKGNYSSLEADRLKTVIPYKVIAANKNIGSGIAFYVQDKYYSGSEMDAEKGIIIDKSDITFKADKNHADFSSADFEIVEGSYSKNKFTGIASVTIRGINEYGGTKVVKFKIRKKSIF